MIDIHCHILPGLDDGPKNLEQSLAMCRMAAADGIRTIVATPHFKPGSIQASSYDVYAKIAELKAALAREGIMVAVLPGADVAVTPELAAYLKAESYLTINGSKRYFLAELPHDTVPPGWDAFLLSFTTAGLIPILTHPERNPWFAKHAEALFEYVIRGGMVQITAACVTGSCGEYSREFSIRLLRHNLVHAIATDAHDCELRQPVLSAAYKATAEVIGEERAGALVKTIPQAIIEGRHISLPEAIPFTAEPKKKAWIKRLVSS
jgi:protein-tyrosine phosphatase